MSDWDLMMPGMGLTAIGLAGVFLSYLGIANTFLTGMQALSGLTMFIGLVFLSAGILSGGVSTSNRAKATTLVIFGISGSIGAFALSQNTNVTSLPRFVGVLLIIIIPTVVIAFTAMRMSQYLKPISVIFLLAMAVGIISYSALGFIGPGAQFSLQPATVKNETATNVAPTPNVPIVPVTILLNASIKGNPNYQPNTVTAEKGNIIEWKNNDKAVHTVTSASDAGATFDSSLIKGGETYRLDTSKLNETEYDYMCTVHPFMTGKIMITAPQKPIITNVTIVSGASTQSAGQKYFDPADMSIKVGTTVVWTNKDSAAHTVTSGNPSAGPSGTFDSGLIKAGNTFQYKFSSAGTTEYFCTIHPWMTGKVTVG
ncbi:MAG TPA: plastocyanin/azurin family copper-binding protein [Nitrosopumilaceae archaeon]|nr:plastocyanin/azurin family copper-binding protein [Nitrosopumilaceae archaeon]